MIHRSNRFIACVVVALSLAALPRAARSQVGFYTNFGSFQAVTSTTLQSTFESFASFCVSGTIYGSITDGLVTVTQVGAGGPLIIIDPPCPQTTNPSPTSNGLTGNGQEEFDLTFSGPAPTAVGFDVISNRFGAPTITVFDTSNALLGSFLSGQAPNTVGFIGVTSGIPIGRIHWLANSGAIENTVLDNVRVGIWIPPADIPEPGPVGLLCGLSAGLLLLLRRVKSG